MNVEEVTANQQLLRYLADRAAQYGYRDHSQMHGTHPDVAMRLWDELGSQLPEDCHAIAYGSPVLVRPSSAIIFAFAGGTHTYAMRLPPDLRDVALRAGATRVYHYRAYRELNISEHTFDLAEIGSEWVFGHWLDGEDRWCRAAYEFAAQA